MATPLLAGRFVGFIQVTIFQLIFFDFGVQICIQNLPNSLAAGAEPRTPQKELTTLFQDPLVGWEEVFS